MKKNFIRLENSADLRDDLKHAVVAIGNFDGVHRGHQAVLKQALYEAQCHNRPAIVLTFEPHPRNFFQPNNPVDRLTTANEKAEILKRMGFDCVLEMAFDQKFSAQSPSCFINKIIVHDLIASRVVTGYNFHFGSKRLGNPAFLRAEGQSLGFSVTLVDPYKDNDNIIVSSSRIRTLLAAGQVEKAADLLGYRYTLVSKVEHGTKLGRKLGFPTANMILPEQTGLSYGVYAVRFRRSNGTIFDGVASFGKRPTVHQNATPILETYLFDFDGDLYEETAFVSFFSRLRGEITFNSFNALIFQMQEDEKVARKILHDASALSSLDQQFTFDSWSAN